MEECVNSDQSGRFEDLKTDHLEKHRVHRLRSELYRFSMARCINDGMRVRSLLASIQLGILFDVEQLLIRGANAAVDIQRRVSRPFAFVENVFRLRNGLGQARCVALSLRSR